MDVEVQFRVYTFWNQPPPLEITQIPQRKLIDIDEFGVTPEWCNRTHGWAFKVFRVQKDGHCSHGEKITILFPIEPGDYKLPPN